MEKTEIEIFKMENKTSIHAVDDDEEILQIIEFEFSEDDEYNFVFFSKSTDFLASLRDDLDLIIMDVNMPDFDVVAAAELIEEKCPGAYTIIISASSDGPTLAKLLNLGVYRYCLKDGGDFLVNLREYIKSAQRKILFKKSIQKWNLSS